jgi:hypothetical protein
MKRLPSWRTVYSYTKEFTDKGRAVKNVLRKHAIKFKTEFDRVIGAVLIRVHSSDFKKASRLLEKEGLI